jgi:hypothetical protein
MAYRMKPQKSSAFGAGFMGCLGVGAAILFVLLLLWVFGKMVGG